MIGAPGGATPVGVVPLPGFPGAGGAGIVLSTGVYAFRIASQSLQEVYRSDRTLSASSFADLDGDGAPDVVATGGGADDIDLLYRLPLGFLRFRFDTGSPVLSFLIGDYDGNRVADIAYVEKRLKDERLLIAYGTSDKLLPGLTVGTFAHVLSMIPGEIPDSTDRLNVVSDLALLYDVGLGSQLSLLHGSPQRTMLAFFDPRRQPVDPESLFRGVVAGNFGGNGLGNDVIAVEQTGTTNLWLSRGAMGGDLDSGQNSSLASDIKTCDAVSLPNGPFCIAGAMYAAWPLAADRDMVVGFDTKHEVVAFDPRALLPNKEAVLARFPDKMIATSDAAVRSVQTVAAADGTSRLVVSLGPSAAVAGSRTVGGVNVCTFDPAVGPDCVELGAAITEAVGGSFTCVDAAPARVVAASRFSPPAETSPELVVLCHDIAGTDRLFRVAIDGTRIEPLLDIDAADALQIGDVTGDAIDDLVLIDSTGGVPTMRLVRQCNSRDVGDCRSAP